LFKVGKGKNEIYLKDETSYNDYILKKICDRVRIEIPSEEKELSDINLYMFVCSLSEYFEALNRMDNQGVPTDIVETLAREEIEGKNDLKDEEKIINLKTSIEALGYTVEDPQWSEDRRVFELNITQPKAIKIGRGFIYSINYQKCVQAGKNIMPYNSAPFVVVSGGDDSKRLEIETIKDLLEHLIEEGKKGINVQRYKGLGEMNPDQLWETTMHPDKRTLLQVKIEDALDADEIFTVLMGDQVEPRREFIQNNALEVGALDI
jgi:DNA gyrase subunit B